jgi:murein DD-endopeptidase MepM/ murein hydrolase activator NlpD
MKNQSLFVALMYLLSACAVSNQPAPIEYNHNSYTKNRPSNKTKSTVDDGEIISKGSLESKQSDIIEPNEDLTQGSMANDEFIVPENRHLQSKNKIIYHEVQVGETIEDIAKKYGQTVKDIAALNDLSPPYYLDEFQVIKINQAQSVDKGTTPVDIQETETAELTQLTKEATIATGPAVEVSNVPVEPVAVASKDFIPPVSGKILSKFGTKTNSGTNKGISISAKQGTKVLASAGGKVIYSDYDATFGNLIIVKLDGKNTFMSYAHLDDLPLAKGANVKQGDVIGYVGTSGKVNEPQLNFGIREGKVAKDPEKLVHFDK